MCPFQKEIVLGQGMTSITYFCPLGCDIETSWNSYHNHDQGSISNMITPNYNVVDQIFQSMVSAIATMLIDVLMMVF